MIESKAISAAEESALLNEWFETVHFDVESHGLPPLEPEEDDEERARYHGHLVQRWFADISQPVPEGIDGYEYAHRDEYAWSYVDVNVPDALHVIETETAFQALMRANPYHDKLGKFASHGSVSGKAIGVGSNDELPAENVGGPTLYRGLVLQAESEDLAEVQRIADGQATEEDIMKHINTKDVGGYWYSKGEGFGFEDSKEFAYGEETAQLHASYYTGDDPVTLDPGEKIFFEIPVVMTGTGPSNWMSANNPDDGMMGNSYLPRGSQVHVTEIAYSPNSTDFVTIKTKKNMRVDSTGGDDADMDTPLDEFMKNKGMRANPYHSKTDGKFTSKGGGVGVAERPAPPARRISASQARGNSRPVSEEEFDRIADQGRVMLAERQRDASPITGLDHDWDTIKDKSYAEVQQAWGGATIDSHTGRALESTADKYALTVKPQGMNTVSIGEHATHEEFSAAMDTAKERFRPALENKGSHLGVFHDDENKRIDIDPVVVVDSLHEVEAIGAHTYAIGGAYHFKSGDGFWPPHVEDSGNRAKSILLGDDVHWLGPGEWCSFADEVQRPFVSRHLQRTDTVDARYNKAHDKLGKFATKSGGLHPEQYKAMVPTGVYSTEHKEKLVETLEATKEGKVLAHTMIHFQEHEYVVPFRKDIEGVLNGQSLPPDRHERAEVFLSAVKHAPPDLAPPKVYRGMTLAEPPPVKGMYEPGTTHNFAVASFSSSREVSESYQRMTADRGNISVMVELTGSKKLLPIENLSKNEQLFGEHEWVGSGRFKVEAVTQVGTDVTVHMVQEGTLG